MILFLEYSVGGRRGGEQFTEHLHLFLKRKFPDIKPADYSMRPVGFDSTFKAIRFALRSAKENKPDLIIVDVSSGARNVLGVQWMKNQGKNVLTIVQDQRMEYKLNNFLLLKWFIHQCEKYLIRNADIIVVNSKYISGLARKFAKIDTPIIIAHPGLEIADEGENNIESSNKISNAQFNLLNVGVPEERKGTKYLIEALPLLSDLDFHLHITGGFNPSKPYVKSILKFIENHGLRNRITFHGFICREKLIELFRYSTLYLQPSLSEGYGIAMAEALSFGLPVIASNVAAIPEMIENGVNGLLVEPANPKALADAIRMLVNNPELRRKISAININKAKTLARWDDFDLTLERELIPLIEKMTGLQAL